MVIIPCHLQKGKGQMNKVSDHVLAYLAGTCANIDSVNGKYHVYDDEMDFGKKTLEQLERFCKKENKLAKEATGEQPYKLYKADDEDICYYFWNKGYPSFEESQTVASWIGVEHELYLVKEVK